MSGPTTGNDPGRDPGKTRGVQDVWKGQKVNFKSDRELTSYIKVHFATTILRPTQAILTACSVK